MQRLLTATETIGETYGLFLNKHKCVLLIKTMPGIIRFKDGTRVVEVEETNYLGCKLNIDTDMFKELKERINKCRLTLKRLDTFWLKGNSSYKFKLRVYNCIIKAKLMYGLDSSQLNPRHLSMLDTFHLQGLR